VAVSELVVPFEIQGLPGGAVSGVGRVRRLRRSGWYAATGRWSARRGADRPVDLPCLDGLELPALLPGDVPPARPAPPRCSGLDEAVCREDGLVFWLPDGTLASGEDRERAWLGGAWTVVAPAERIVARARFYRGGVAVTVITDFVPVDLAAKPDGPPVLWETMIWQRRRGVPDRELGAPTGPRWRYSSRDAALHGHRRVAAAIRAEQRQRAVQLGFPRRGRR
jgi:hypothetical protein